MFRKTKTVIDPVCGRSVDPAKADAQVEHGKQTYYFCSQHCADRVAAEPETLFAAGNV